jgi:hypothetical protein
MHGQDVLQELRVDLRSDRDAQYFVDFHRFVLPAYAASSESQIVEYQLSLSLNSHLSKGAGRGSVNTLSHFFRAGDPSI